MINQFIRAVTEGLGQRRVDVAEFAILNQIDSRQRPFGDNPVAGLALPQRRLHLPVLGNVLLDCNPTFLPGYFQSADPGLGIKWGSVFPAVSDLTGQDAFLLQLLDHFLGKLEAPPRQKNH